MNCIGIQKHLLQSFVRSIKIIGCHCDLHGNYDLTRLLTAAQKDLSLIKNKTKQNKTKQKAQTSALGKTLSCIQTKQIHSPKSDLIPGQFFAFPGKLNEN